MDTNSLSNAEQNLLEKLEAACPKGCSIHTRENIAQVVSDYALQEADFVILDKESKPILVIQLDSAYDKSDEKTQHDLDVDQGILGKGVPVLRVESGPQPTAIDYKALIKKSLENHKFVLLDSRTKFEWRLKSFRDGSINTNRSMMSWVKARLKMLLIQAAVMVLVISALVGSYPAMLKEARQQLWFYQLMESSEFLRDIFADQEMVNYIMANQRYMLEQAILEKQPWLKENLNPDAIVERVTGKTHNQIVHGIAKTIEETPVMPVVEDATAAVVGGVVEGVGIGVGNVFKELVTKNATNKPTDEGNVSGRSNSALVAPAKVASAPIFDTPIHPAGNPELDPLPFGKKDKNKNGVDCEEVSSPRGKSLVNNAAEIRQGSGPAYWKAMNKTTQTVAITINQDNKDVAIAFIGPQQTYQSQIPGTYLRFKARANKKSCIDPTTGMVFPSSIPYRSVGLNTQKEDADYYSYAIFETEIIAEGRNIKLNTKLAGYTKAD